MVKDSIGSEALASGAAVAIKVSAAAEANAAAIRLLTRTITWRLPASSWRLVCGHGACGGGGWRTCRGA